MFLRSTKTVSNSACFSPSPNDSTNSLKSNSTPFSWNTSSNSISRTPSLMAPNSKDCTNPFKSISSSISAAANSWIMGCITLKYSADTLTWNARSSIMEASSETATMPGATPSNTAYSTIVTNVPSSCSSLTMFHGSQVSSGTEEYLSPDFL